MIEELDNNAQGLHAPLAWKNCAYHVSISCDYMCGPAAVCLKILVKLIFLNHAFIVFPRFAARPDHWRSKQASKESTYNDFYATFATDDNKSTKMSGFLGSTSNKNSKAKTVKEISKEIGQSLASATPFLGMSGSSRNSKKGKQNSKKNAQIGRGGDGSFNRKKGKFY